MLDDSDIHSTRHARALVGGVLAGVIGDTLLYVSGGAEHQGPPGGGPVAIIGEGAWLAARPDWPPDGEIADILQRLEAVDGLDQARRAYPRPACVAAKSRQRRNLVRCCPA